MKGADFPNVDALLYILDKSSNKQESEYNCAQKQEGDMPGILVNANVAIKNAVGLVSAGS